MIKNKVIVVRIKHNQSLELLIKKLEEMGFCMFLDKKTGAYKCG